MIIKIDRNNINLTKFLHSMFLIRYLQNIIFISFLMVYFVVHFITNIPYFLKSNWYR